MRRRDFVRHAGATLAAASWASVAGANERLVLGMIGCGGRGQDLIQHFLSAGAVVGAVCDPDQSHREKARALAGGSAEMIKDFRALLERKEIDAVVVATPDHWHALPAILACQAGKDVYVEKPLAYSVQEGRAIVEAARRYGRIVQIGTQQRAGEHYRKAVERIRRGELGKVTRARVWNVWNNTLGQTGGRWSSIGNPPDSEPPPGVDYDLWLGPAPKRPFNPNRFHWNYVYYWDYAGGMMTGWGVHHVDIVHWALGVDAPLAVAASGGKYVLTDSRETPDTLDAFFDYPGFTLQASFYHGSARRIEGSDYGVAFYGSRATMLLTREGDRIWPEGEKAEPLRAAGSPLDGPFQREFIENCKARRQPMCDAETGHRSTIPVLLANIAYKTGRKLKWDAAREVFVGDPEANALLGREYRKPWELPRMGAA